MKRKLVSLLSALLAIALLLSACGGSGESSSGGDSDSESGSENTVAKTNLVVAVTAEARSIDPFGSNDSTSSTVKDQIFDTMFTHDASGTVIPSLVDTYEWVDDNTLHVTAKDGIMFHDGTELVVGDFLYTITKGKESEYTTWITENIDTDNSMVLEDGETLELKFFTARGDSLAALCFLYIVSESATEAEGYDPEATPNGTGAFKFVEHVAGDRVEFASNADYWNGAPAFETMTFRIITEAASRTIEVESGGVDIIYNVAQNDIELLEANEDVALHRAPNYSLNFIGFNCQVAPFDDPLVRQAITYALDKESIVTAVYGETGSVATGPISDVIFGYSDDVMEYTYDIDKAKELLEQAGYADGLSFTLTVSDSAQRVLTAEIIQNQLGQIGITVETEVLENATYLDRIVESDFQMYALGWTTNTGDADYGLYETYHTDSPTWANTCRYSNPEVDDLLEQARVSTDSDERLDLYAQVQQIIVEEAPQIYIWNGEEILAARSNVQGLELSPSGRHNFATVYFS